MFDVWLGVLRLCLQIASERKSRILFQVKETLQAENFGLTLQVGVTTGRLKSVDSCRRR